jgi:hypothetical protein
MTQIELPLFKESGICPMQFFKNYVHRRKARAPATAMPNPCGTEKEPAPPTKAEEGPLGPG